MRIGTKLVILLTVPLVALLVLFGYLDQQGSRKRLQEEFQREGRGIALTARIAIEDYLRDRKPEDIQELLEKISGYERILGIRIFARDGTLLWESSSLKTLPFRQPGDLDRVLKSRVPVETHRVLGKKPVVSILFPLSSPQGDLLGAGQFLQLESYIEDEARLSRNYLAVLTAAMILAAAVVVLLVTHFGVTRPVEELVQSFREVGAHGVASRVSVRRRDDFGRLAREFNTMCERLQAAQVSLEAEQTERRHVEAQLRRAERLASIGRLSAGLAHEIGTPLNVIGGRADALRRKLAGNELADKNLGIIVSQIERIARIVRGMLDFAKAREPRLDPLDLAPVLQRVLDFLGQRFEESGIRTEILVPEGLPAVLADPDQIYGVFLNLAANSLDAMPQGGVFRVRADQVQATPPQRPGSPSPHIAVALEDTGKGIAPENLDRIFEPFFTTKEVGRGTGLGLSVSYGIIQEHGGWIDVTSEMGHGSRLTVYLPVPDTAGGATRAAAGGRS